MLRRRRTCNPQELSHSLSDFVCDNETRKKEKQNLSPFPEIDGKFIKENEKKPGQSSSRNVNRSAEMCENQPPVFIKPSEVVLIEKKMSELPDKTSDDNASSIWDSVVSWMKSAVELIGLEATPTAGTELSSLQSRKRPLRESNVDQNSLKSSRPNKKGRRMSLAPGVLERQKRRRERSPEGVGLQLLATPIKSTELVGEKVTSVSRVYSTMSFQRSARKYESGAMGLNELTNLKMTDTIRIRNPLLKKYYDENDEKKSPSLRRSPRIAAKKESQVTTVPPPPPPLPPSVPPPPLPPSVPPPPPPFSLHPTSDVIPTNSPSSISCSTLKQMQSRLRNRMMKKGGMEENRNQDTNTKTNVKANQWVELQAHKRKLSVEEFLALADQKRKDFGIVLKGLQTEGPLTMEIIRLLIEEVQDASQWFSGGSREMKEEFPLYKSLEHKIELMTECVQIQSEMNDVLSDTNPVHQRASFGSPHSRLDSLRSEFVHRHKQWGSVLTTNGKSWHNASLPVDNDLLSNAKLYLVTILTKYTDIIETESLKVGGVMCSIKSRRVSLVKDALKEGLNLITTLLGYCSDSCQCFGAGTRTSPCCVCVSDSLDKACTLSEHFVNVCVMEYDGHIKCSKRQDVCEHFQSILKTLGSLKSLVMQFPDLSKQAKKSGIMSVLDNSSNLSNLLYTTCVKLIQHIDSQSRLIMSASNTTNSREVVLWMMFGCKYVNSVLEVIGTRQANEKGVNDLLQQLQQMEGLLPD